MDFELYRTGKAIRANIGAQSFQVYPPFEGGAVLNGRQLGFVLSGDYGEVVQAWAKACLAVAPDVQPRFSWGGIINSLGDHAEVSPGWRERERDYNRIGPVELPVSLSEFGIPALRIKHQGLASYPRPGETEYVISYTNGDFIRIRFRNGKVVSYTGTSAEDGADVWWEIENGQIVPKTGPFQVRDYEPWHGKEPPRGLVHLRDNLAQVESLLEGGVYTTNED